MYQHKFLLCEEIHSDVQQRAKEKNAADDAHGRVQHVSRRDDEQYAQHNQDDPGYEFVFDDALHKGCLLIRHAGIRIFPCRG